VSYVRKVGRAAFYDAGAPRRTLSNLRAVSARAFTVVLAAIALVALLAFGVFKSEPSLAVGDPAPDRALPKLGAEGTSSLEDFRGSWVLVNFWASWCGPCAEESPAIQSFLEEHAEDDFVVYGIDSRDATDAGLEFIEEYGLTWEMARDGDGEHMDEWAIPGLPESFLVDPDGDVAALCRGPLERAQLDAMVEPFLETGEPGPAGDLPSYCSLG
jgi:cytochrome c biogenesis protein CcmG/thiol:disulfide interchange protein DsbE